MKQTILSFLILFTLSTAIYAQKQISGTVTNEISEALPGATIIVKNTTIGTTTNSDGAYSLSLPENANVLIFSFIGMETQEIAIDGREIIDVHLNPAATNLDEVIAIGYGTVRKSDITGSVANIRSEDIAQSQSTSFMNAMQGKMPGVQITSESGEPGSGINIRIRGANSISGTSTPLFVIDGVQLDVNKGEVATSGSSNGTMDPFSTLNPSDIASIEVLKDASATAIFGSRGANGVVIITTKSGGSGKPSLEYEGSMSVSEATKKIEVLSPEEYLTYAELRGRDAFLMIDSDDDGTYDTARDFSEIASHNWQDEALRTAITHQHMLSVSGGNSNSNYSAGLGILSQEGLVLNNGFDRYNFRIRLNHKQSDKLKLGFNLNSAFSELYGAANNGGPDSYTGVVQLLVMACPWEVKDSDVETCSDAYISPIKLIEEAEKTTRLMRTIGSFNLEYEILNGLTYKAILGGNYSKSKLKEFYSSETNWGYKNDGLAAITEVGTYSYNHSSQLNFIKSFNNHHLDAMVAFEVNHYNLERFRNRVSGFDDESTGVNDISKGANLLEYSSTRWSTNRLSYLGRINYNINNKYLLTASLRADGSDKFGEGNRWGYFPSGAFAWRISNEDFLKNNNYLSNLKLRLSYGETGNERISAYSYFAQMENTYYTSNDEIIYGLSPSSKENPDLKWETTTQYNAGIDLGLIKNRINLSLDYYIKQTRDMLLEAPVASQSGYYSQWLNIGRVDNKGLELMISTVNIQKKNFSWESSFNITFNKNEVKDLGDSDYLTVTISGGWITNPGRIIKGKPIDTMYGYEFDGIYQLDQFTWQDDSDPSIEYDDRVYSLKDDEIDFVSGTVAPGTQKYKDVSGADGVPDGEVDDTYDRKVIGDSNPKHIGGFSNTLRYKNFDLSCFFQWSYGNDIFNAAKLREHGLQSYMNVTKEYFYNYWSETNPSNKYPGIGQISSVPSSYYVEDGSYLRLKTLSIGYRLPKTILNGTGISDVRFFVTGTNLWTLTNYSGLDPEVNSNNALLPGFERFSYPRSKTVSFGVSIKL